MTAIAYRQARIEDAADIHALLLRLAPEIPLLVDTLEREEALYALIRNCGRLGESWVALDERERIIGFVLVDPEQLERHYAEHEIFDLRYAGVAPEHRGRGVFSALIAKVLARLRVRRRCPRQRSPASARRRRRRQGRARPSRPGPRRGRPPRKIRLPTDRLARRAGLSLGAGGGGTMTVAWAYQWPR